MGVRGRSLSNQEAKSREEPRERDGGQGPARRESKRSAAPTTRRVSKKQKKKKQTKLKKQLRNYLNVILLLLQGGWVGTKSILHFMIRILFVDLKCCFPAAVFVFLEDPVFKVKLVFFDS